MARAIKIARTVARHLAQFAGDVVCGASAPRGWR